MPWICSEDGNGFSSEELTDDQWRQLDRILNAHGTPIVDEDPSGVRIDPITPEKAEALTADLRKWGFEWVNGSPEESN